MSASINDFFRGDSRAIHLTINSTDYIGGAAWLTLKAVKDDPDAIAALQKKASIVAGVDPDTAEATISLSPADTNITPKRYYYDIQLVNAAGSVVTTALSGIVTVLADITRSTS